MDDLGPARTRRYGGSVPPIVTTDVDRAVAVLRAGGLVAFPTETVYGLGADAADARAVTRIFTAKGRPPTHPVIVHLASSAGVARWAGEVPSEARRLAERFWPGPLTVLLPRHAGVPDVVTGGLPTVGLRVPDHPLALELLQRFGGGIAAPSANRFGRVSPTSARHVMADLGDRVDLVLDGGTCPVGVESTIVDLSDRDAGPLVLRQGGISVEELTAALGRTVNAWTGDGPARAPGMLARHYAPRARVEVAAGAEDLPALAGAALAGGRRVGVLAPTRVVGLPDGVIELGPAGDPPQFARRLYEQLRRADEIGLDVLIVVPPPPVGIGRAVNDRLQRAAAR